MRQGVNVLFTSEASFWRLKEKGTKYVEKVILDVAKRVSSEVLLVVALF
jgi:hypothetical protein